MTKPNNEWRSLVLSVLLAAGFAVPGSAQLLNSGQPKANSEQPPATEDVSEPIAVDSFSRSTQIFGQWSVQCSERSGRESCFIETVIWQSGETPQDLVVVRINQGAEGLLGTIVTPNRTALSRGVTLKIGETEQTANYVICGPVNCHARFAAAPGFEEAMKSAEKLDAIVYVFAESTLRGISIPVELKGFGEAYQRLQILDPQ
ncbi:Invasion protein IalB, involved in pathogenesis [Maritimibacter sp. HL-12]|nr:Invasion protein IalB, involved in pathogenesis [Maritimibacter sp. HL-12]